MDQITSIEPARMDDLIAMYRELQAQFDRVRDRLRRAEENKQTVQPRIYDRVRAEYDRELDSIRARMSPLRDEITRIHDSLEAQCQDAAAMARAVDEELAELEFRHRTGEYEEAAFATLRRALDERAAEARSQHTLLESTLSALAAMRRRSASADVPPPAVPDRVMEATPEPDVPAPVVPTPDVPSLADAMSDDDAHAPVITLDDVIPHRPVLSAPRVNAEVRGDAFENPHDWISDGMPDGSQRPRISTPAPASVPAASAPAEPAAVSAPEADFPSLVFVSGPHAGQAIALVPTTLTIGREHDNNIEIKDPDVARYHARILRERDQYVVEDLNSSTGTWVNGERRQRTMLSHGDVIRLGQTELALDFEWTHGVH